MARKYWPSMAKKISVSPMLATVNRRFLKTRTSSIGWEERSSHWANPNSRMAPTRNAPITLLFDHPSVGPSMIAHRTATSPATDMIAPGGSRAGAAGSLEEGSR